MITPVERNLAVSRVKMAVAGLGALLTFVPPSSAEDLPKQGNFAVTYTAAGGGTDGLGVMFF